VGDTFLSAACIAYYGAFTGPYRASLVAAWLARSQELGIPASPSCNLHTSLASPAQVRPAAGHACPTSPGTPAPHLECTLQRQATATRCRGVQVREWHAMGLPHDAVSVDSAIVATHGRCWPLCIDPQVPRTRGSHAEPKRRARSYIRSASTLRLVCAAGASCSLAARHGGARRAAGAAAGAGCVPARAGGRAAHRHPCPAGGRRRGAGPRTGAPLAEAGATPFPWLGACRLCFALTTRLLGMLPQQWMLCMRQVYKDSNGRSLLRLGDIEIDYNPAFRLYLTSRNPNPHFLPEVRRGPDAAAAADGLHAPPEVCLRSIAMRRGHHDTRRRQVCIRVSVINFTVTAEGLEEQLLGDCVRRERPDLEEQRDSLLQSIAADKRQLQAPPCLPHCPRCLF